MCFSNNAQFLLEILSLFKNIFSGKIFVLYSEPFMLGIFLDIEANGLDVFKHHCIELAYKIVDLETGSNVEAFQATLLLSQEEWKTSDPNSLKVNGFSFEIVKNGTPKKEVATSIKRSFKKTQISRENSVFICQNPSFDRQFFNQIISASEQESLFLPYHWLDLASMHFAKCSLILKKKPLEVALSKNRIAKLYGLPPEKAPHRAMAGVDHLILCYKHVIGFTSKHI